MGGAVAVWMFLIGPISGIASAELLSRLFDLTGRPVVAASLVVVGVAASTGAKGVGVSGRFAPMLGFVSAVLAAALFLLWTLAMSGE